MCYNEAQLCHTRVRSEFDAALSNNNTTENERSTECQSSFALRFKKFLTERLFRYFDSKKIKTLFPGSEVTYCAMYPSRAAIRRPKCPAHK